VVAVWLAPCPTSLSSSSQVIMSNAVLDKFHAESQLKGNFSNSDSVPSPSSQLPLPLSTWQFIDNNATCICQCLSQHSSSPSSSSSCDQPLPLCFISTGLPSLGVTVQDHYRLTDCPGSQRRQQQQQHQQPKQQQNQMSSSSLSSSSPQLCLNINHRSGDFVKFNGYYYSA
jgi:hypothetical protein